MNELQNRQQENAHKMYLKTQKETWVRTDKLFSYLMLAQWIFAVICAMVISPQTYSGAVGTWHPHMIAALVLGGLLTLLPCSFVYLRPGETITRHVIAITQMGMSALLIHLTGGRIETHFHIFGSLAFLAFYGDWKVLVTAAAVTSLDHILRGYFFPLTVYGVTSSMRWEWLEHAGWVVFEISFLIPAGIRMQNQMMGVAERQAELELTNEMIEKKVAERTEELAQTQKQLMHSQKLEAVGQLASGVAHDFNNMLGGILAYSSILKEEYAQDAHLSSCLEVIESSAERGADLTRKLLAFARKGNYEHTSVDLLKTVQETVSLLAPSLNEKIKVEMSVCPSLWATEGDSTQIFQAVMNLAVNARDAMPHGGLIKIAATNIEADDDYCAIHKSVKPGEYIRLSIQDTGTGIPKHIQEKVFEPFFTTKQPGAGTGLGLSMVYGIMNNHKGAVGLYSEEGHGTVFHLYFPRSLSVQKPDQAKEIHSTPKDALKDIDILLADDDQVMRSAATDILTRYGAKVQAFEDGIQALQCLTENPTKFKIVVLDVIMPVMSGIEIFHQMRQVAPDIEYVFSSGYAESAEIADLRANFTVKFIQKPFKAEHLTKELLKKAA